MHDSCDAAHAFVMWSGGLGSTHINYCVVWSGLGFTVSDNWQRWRACYVPPRIYAKYLSHYICNARCYIKNHVQKIIYDINIIFRLTSYLDIWIICMHASTVNCHPVQLDLNLPRLAHPRSRIYLSASCSSDSPKMWYSLLLDGFLDWGIEKTNFKSWKAY